MRTRRKCGTDFLGMLTLRGRCPAADAGARRRPSRPTPDTTRPRCARGRPGRASRSTPAGASRQTSWRSSGPPATEFTASGRRAPTGEAGVGDGPGRPRLPLTGLELPAVIGMQHAWRMYADGTGWRAAVRFVAPGPVGVNSHDLDVPVTRLRERAGTHS